MLKNKFFPKQNGEKLSLFCSKKYFLWRRLLFLILILFSGINLQARSKYLEKFTEKGFAYPGMSPDNLLPEILESKIHRWFIGVQFHPELKSRPQNPHPLFISFVDACISKKNA